MLNYIWAFMVLAGIVYGSLTGNVAAVGNGALDASKEAVTLCVTMLGVMALWMGIMEIAKKSGLMEGLSRACAPMVSWLFPRLDRKGKAFEYITTNIIANVLGLGWAATPSGLKAMEELAKLEEERGAPGYADEGVNPSAKGAGSGRLSVKGTGAAAPPAPGSGLRIASNEMCTFLILNISSLQLIPVNMIAYRSQYGSVNPAAVVGPAIAATAVSTGVAVVYCKWKDRGRGV